MQGAQQAALAAIPLDIILHHQAYAGDALQQWLSWGRQITAASFLSIIIGGPVCAVIARFLGPTCLEQVCRRRLFCSMTARCARS